MKSRKSRLSKKGRYVGETFKSVVLTIYKNEVQPIESVGQHEINSVAFLADGKHIVSGGKEGMIRRWRVEDGKEVETPMDARSDVNNIAVSRDGKWIVSGTISGELMVWDAKSELKVTEWKGHSDWVVAVDVSPDGKRIATGSNDATLCVWSLWTGKRLLGPLEHKDSVVAAKFSPNGCFIATAAWLPNSVRIYNSQSGDLLVDLPVGVASRFNQSLVWASNSKNLFALSHGKINYIDASTGTTLSSWSIPSSSAFGCIALPNKGTFIAASADSSVSFWDTTTHKQIGSIINHTHNIESMAISANYDFVIGGGKAITLRNVCDELPSSYCEDVSALPRRFVVRDLFLITNHLADCNRFSVSEKSSA